MRWFRITLIVVVVIFPLGACAPRQREDAGAERERALQQAEDAKISSEMGLNLEDQKVFSFNFEGYGDDGKKKWEVIGKSANIVSDIVTLNDVNAQAYTDFSEVRLKADTGRFNKTTKDMTLTNNVEVHTSDGISLFTDTLCWAAETEEITTEDRVLIEREDVLTEGVGAVAKPKLKKVKLNKDISVTMKPATTITCDGSLDFDYENAIAVFNTNVVIEDEKGQIYADKMTAYFNKEAKKLEKVEAEGNVRIVRGESSSLSERALYNAIDGTVTLLGRPKLELNPNDKTEDFGLDDGLF